MAPSSSGTPDTEQRSGRWAALRSLSTVAVWLERRRWRPDVRWALVALLVYTLTTLVVMAPIPFRLGSVIAGKEYGDAWQYTWSLWWAKRAILEPGGSLSRIPLMNHPAGVEHPFLLTTVAVSLLALPLGLLLSPAAVYNAQLLLSVILSGMAMYWLCSELVGDRCAAIVGGFIFAFFPNKTGHLLAGHLPQVSVYWFPLYALLLRRALLRPGWKTALPASLVLMAATLVHVMHLAYLVLPVTLVVLLATLLEMGRGYFAWRRIGWLAFLFGLAALVTLPFLLPTVRISGASDSYLDAPGVVKHSTDLLAFFTPSPYHPLLRALGLVPPFAQRLFEDVSALGEGLAYPGLVALGLSLWGLVRSPRKTWMWWVLALLAASLSLGPLLKVNGELVRYQVDGVQSYVVLPYALLKQLPLVGVGRTPGRLNETTMFALAILAAYGMAALRELGTTPLSAPLASQTTSSTMRRAVRILLPALLIIGAGFEYVTVWPFPVSASEIPPAIQRIADEPGDGALLHLPTTLWREVNSRALYYQTAAPRPIVGGYIHRIPPEVRAWSALLLGLAQPEPAAGDIVPQQTLAERVAWLRHFAVDYVVFHKLRPQADAPYRDFVQTLLGTPRYEDDAVVAFSVPRLVPAPEQAHLYALSETGWYPAEQDGGIWRRWMYDDGQLYAYSTREQVGSLRFSVDSHLSLPVLQIYLGDRPLDAVIVDQPALYTTRPFTLSQGLNVVRFHATAGCPQVVDDPRCWAEAMLSSPVDDAQVVCDPGDVRSTCRTFVFHHMSFVPRASLPEGDGLDVNFGDQMRLRAWHLDPQELRPGGVLTLTLAWQPEIELSERHVVFVHLLNADGILVAQHDAPPAGTSLPVWPPGATFAHPVTLELPDGLAVGGYHLLLGVYLWPSLERLPLLDDVPGAADNVMVLTRLRVAP